MSMLIFLVGFMGAGKTTLARKMAAKMNMDMVDLDQCIEMQAGKSINLIFETEGELAFRELENKILKELSERKNTIIATGGGTPCFMKNMERMNAKGLTIYLKMHHGSLFHRLAPGKDKRPLIKTMNDTDLMDYIMNQLPRREQFYNKAQLVLKAESIKVDDVIAAITKLKKN
jgi:shikimate kinase